MHKESCFKNDAQTLYEENETVPNYVHAPILYIMIAERLIGCANQKVHMSQGGEQCAASPLFEPGTSRLQGECSTE
ncbi:hypothetical protein DPMN_172933 [Dreissena polymorpha]|uniref:Uncharacterized protein n=1 Tax=Dreissena polymorpha TaxID=45954 RepID=A0A9D4IGH7_DREPO|nr:hypothetical protein DPMN_172933 [Dreissena polymorpha]